MKRLFRGKGLVGAVDANNLTVGPSGSAISGINFGNLTVAVGTVGPGTTGTVTTTLTGAASGDRVFLNPTNPVNGVALGGGRVSGANQLTTYWVNAGASEAVVGNVTVQYALFDLT